MIHIDKITGNIASKAHGSNQYTVLQVNLLHDMIEALHVLVLY